MILSDRRKQMARGLARGRMEGIRNLRTDLAENKVASVHDLLLGSLFLASLVQWCLTRGGK